MISVRHSTTIARAVDEVFAFVADTTNDPGWHTDLTQVRRRGSDPTRLGTEFDIEIKPFMGQSNGSLTVTAYEPNRLLELHGRMGPMQPTIRYTFRAADGGTSLDRQVDLQPAGLLRLLQPLMRPTIAKRNGQFLVNLKELLER